MNHYSPVRPLGRGTFGAVLLAREKKDGGVLCVIKQLDVTRLCPADQFELQAEVGILQKLSHPNIVFCLGSFSEQSTINVVWAYSDGGSLAAAIKQRREEGGRFADDEAVAVLAQCAAALCHLHGKGVVHRNLKCENIFLSKAGDIKIGDFGFALLCGHTPGSSTVLMATPGHLAPEACEGSPYNSAADVWSLGVAVYTVLALHPPFQSYNAAALVVKIRTADPRPLPLECTDGTRDVVASMLQKVPESRPSAEQLLALPPIRAGLLGSLQATSAGQMLTERGAAHNAVAGHEERTATFEAQEGPTGDVVDKLLCTVKADNDAQPRWSLKDAPPLVADGQQRWSLKDAPPLAGMLKRPEESNATDDDPMDALTGMTPQAIRLSYQKESSSLQVPPGNLLDTMERTHVHTPNSAEAVKHRRTPLSLAGGSIGARRQSKGALVGLDAMDSHLSPHLSPHTNSGPAHETVAQPSRKAARRSYRDERDRAFGLAGQLSCANTTAPPRTPIQDIRPISKEDEKDSLDRQFRDRHLDELMDELLERERRLSEPI